MYVNIVAAAVASFIVGFLWHGPLFGKVWAKLSGVKMDASKKKSMATPMAAAFVAHLAMAYVLNMVLGFAGATTPVAAVIVGAWLWLGFIATVSLNHVLWEGKSVNLYLFNNAYHLINLAIMGAVLVSVAA